MYNKFPRNRRKTNSYQTWGICHISFNMDWKNHQNMFNHLHKVIQHSSDIKKNSVYKKTSCLYLRLKLYNYATKK